MGEISAAGDAPTLSSSTNEENAQIGTSRPRKPPLLSLAILRKVCGDEIASLDVNEVSRRVHAGVLLEDDTKLGEAKNGKHQGQPYKHKYWVDEGQNKNCWMVLAKGLNITWGERSEYWTWLEEQESCYSGNIDLPVPKLVKVCWLEINGECKTIMLSPRTTYEVAFVVKKSNESSGWRAPVHLSLSLPDGNEQRRTERLDKLEEEKWIRLSIGKFETTPRTVGKMSFCLKQTEGDWKSGLSVKGVVITPYA